jgi:hypothetical protein
MRLIVEDIDKTLSESIKIIKVGGEIRALKKSNF